MKRLLLILSGFALTACASLPGLPAREPPAAPEAGRVLSADETFALALADRLITEVETPSGRLAGARNEMTALAAALAARAGFDAAPEPAPASSPPSAELSGPPDMAGARSLMHAVHLASYRDVQTLAQGWAELQAAEPSLAGLEARYVAVDLPGRGRFLRLKAGPFDTLTEARRACAPLGERWCDPTDFTGAPVAPR